MGPLGGIGARIIGNTMTRAPAIGALVPSAITRPERRPVAAGAGVWLNDTAASSAAINIVRSSESQSSHLSASVGCHDATAELAREGVRVLRDYAVDEDVLEAFRHLMRFEIRSDVSHLGRIEDEDIGPRARAEHAAILQAEHGGGQARHR